MRPAIEKAQSASNALGFGNQHCNRQNTAPVQAPQAKQLPTIQAAPDDGKAFAMLLFNIGACDLEFTKAAFYRHPEWRHA